MPKVILALALATAALAAASPAAFAAPAADQPSRCFLSRDWSGWKPSEDSKSIYIRVGLSDVYRLDLAYACPSLQWAGVHLVTRLTGPWICHPLDLDLKVADNHGFATACLVSKITPLSPEEAQALPRALKP